MKQNGKMAEKPEQVVIDQVSDVVARDERGSKDIGF